MQNVTVFSVKTYQNTFEIFGDQAPAQMASKREYAKEILFMFTFEFDKEPERYYRIDEVRPEDRLGSAKEIAWMDRVYEACDSKTQYEWNGHWSGLIQEEKLLDFIEEAIEEVV